MSFWNDPRSEARLTPKQSHRWVISYAEGLDGNLSDLTISPYFIKSIERPTYKIETQAAKYLYSHTFHFPKRLIWNPIKIELYDVVDEDSSKAFQMFLRDPMMGKGYKTVEEIKKEYKSHKRSSQLALYYFLQRSGYFDPNEDEENLLLRFRSYNFKKNMIEAITAQKPYDKKFEGPNATGYDLTTPLRVPDESVEKNQSRLLSENNQIYRDDYIQIKELDASGNPIETWKLYNPLVTDVASDKLDYETDGVLKITVGITYDWARLVPAIAGDSRIPVGKSDAPPAPPAPKKPPVIEFGQEAFPNNKSDLSDAAKKQIADLVKGAEAGSTVVIRGYASTAGPAATNLTLSENRAEAVKTAIDTNDKNLTIDILGLGETTRFGSDAASNRKVTVEIIPKK
jgi:outer membrane protein OmpA-like peptidoglycan-associated protein